MRSQTGCAGRRGWPVRQGDTPSHSEIQAAGIVGFSSPCRALERKRNSHQPRR